MKTYFYNGREYKIGVNRNRQYIYVEGKYIYLYRLVYEEHFGPIPSGYEIHHIDGDSLNDSIENLKCVTRSEHVNIHKNRKGKTHSNETKQKISNTLKGKTAWNKGKTNVYSEETKKIMSEVRQKPIQCIETGEIFSSVKSTKIKYSGACANGKVKTAGGFTWRWVA